MEGLGTDDKESDGSGFMISGNTPVHKNPSLGKGESVDEDRWGVDHTVSDMPPAQPKPQVKKP